MWSDLALGSSEGSFSTKGEGVCVSLNTREQGGEGGEMMNECVDYVIGISLGTLMGGFSPLLSLIFLVRVLKV